MTPGHLPVKIPRALRRLPALIGAALLFGAIFAVQHEFRHLRLDDVMDAIEEISLRAVTLAALCTVLAYGILTLYDRLGTIYAGHRVSYGKAAFASFCAYALSHNLGFAAVSGAAVRYRLYSHWGLSSVQIAKTVGFCSLTFGLGGMFLAGLVLFANPREIPFIGDHLPLPVLYAAGALLFAIVAGYLCAAALGSRLTLFGHPVELPRWPMALQQVALATADVAVTASIFWALLPEAPGLTWIVFLGIYIGSYTAGLLASLPGGLGVFDSALLFGLSPFLEADQIVAAILLFRLFYYVIPLFLAGAMFAGNEALMRRGLAVARLSRWSEPDLAVAASTAAVALSGVLLLGVGVLSRRAPDFLWVDPDLAGIALQAGQFVPSLIGAALLVLGFGLVQRVTLAWGVTILLLLLGAVFIVAEGERLWISVVLLLAALLIAPFRTYFYRRSRLLSGPVDPSTAASLLALTLCVLALAGFRRRVHGMPNNAWWELIFSGEIPWALRASIAITVGVAALAVWSLIRPCRVAWRPWNAETIGRLRTIGAPPPQADGVVWGEAERAAIPFRRIGRVMLGLGDPMGQDRDRISAIWRLRDLARQEGLDPAVWGAGPPLLKIYQDIGLTPVPLGADGLPAEDLPQQGPTSDHYLVCVAERDLKQLLPVLVHLSRLAGESLPPATTQARTRGRPPGTAGRAAHKTVNNL